MNDLKHRIAMLESRVEMLESGGSLAEPEHCPSCLGECRVDDECCSYCGGSGIKPIKNETIDRAYLKESMRKVATSPERVNKTEESKLSLSSYTCQHGDDVGCCYICTPTPTNKSGKNVHDLSERDIKAKESHEQILFHSNRLWMLTNTPPADRQEEARRMILRERTLEIEHLKAKLDVAYGRMEYINHYTQPPIHEEAATVIKAMFNEDGTAKRGDEL